MVWFEEYFARREKRTRNLRISVITFAVLCYREICLVDVGPENEVPQVLMKRGLEPLRFLPPTSTLSAPGGRFATEAPLRCRRGQAASRRCPCSSTSARRSLPDATNLRNFIIQNVEVMTTNK